MLSQRFFSLWCFGLLAVAMSSSPVVFAAADDMSCTTRVELSKSGGYDVSDPKIYVNCPSDGRAGFISLYEAPAPSRIDVTLQSSNGKRQEMTLTPEQAALVFGESNEISGGRSLSMRGLYGRFESSQNGLPQLSTSEIRKLGMDPNVVGDTTVAIRNMTLSRSTILRDSTAKIVVRPAGGSNQTAETRCMYVGRLKVVAGSKGGVICPEMPALCTAAVECLDEKVGWVTRSAVCRAEKNGCPASADSCASGNSDLGITTANIENASQPNTRAIPSKAGAIRK